MEFYLLMLCAAVICKAQTTQDARNYEVEDLTAASDYRSVKLTWKYTRSPDPEGFTVRICESNDWRFSPPCKQRHLSLDGSKQKFNMHDVLKKFTRGHYEADIYQLRTRTNYSFIVEPSDALRPMIYSKSDYDKAKSIKSKDAQAATKEFGAKASRCLGNSTDIEVTTGPFFAGKIAVEDVNDDRCAIYGDKNSFQSVYTLTIPHKICGSKKVNASRIETPVLVHENRDLVTANSRRFLVICNFATYTFTIKASVNIPHVNGSNGYIKPIGHSIRAADPNEIHDKKQKFHLNSVRDSRFLAEQSEVIDRNSNKSEDIAKTTQLSATIFLSVTLFIIFIGSMFWLVKSTRSMLSVLKDIRKKHNNIKPLNNVAESIIPDTEDDKEMIIQEDCFLDVSSLNITNEDMEEIQKNNHNKV